MEKPSSKISSLKKTKFAPTSFVLLKGKISSRRCVKFDGPVKRDLVFAGYFQSEFRPSRNE